MVYNSYWQFIHEHLSTFSLKEMDEQTFNSTDTNFNIPYIGKLYADYDRIKHKPLKMN